MADQSGLLGERQELLGTEQPALWVEPASERLEPDDVAGGQLDDRLVVRNDLAAVDAAAQLGGGAQRKGGRFLQPGGVRLDAVAATRLRPVHRPVGVAQQVGRDRRLGGIDREPDAGGDEELDALDVDRFSDRRSQPLGHAPWIEPHICPCSQHDDELVAAETSEQRSLTDGATDPFGQHRQEAVADAVPEAVVDGLEVVEIDEQQRHGADRRAGEQLVDPRQQLGAIGESGQIVVGRGPAQLLGDSPLLGDVLDVGDGERHAIVLGHCDPGARPDVGAVAALVALVEQVRVDDPELEAGPMDRRRLEIVSVGDLADAAADEVVDRPLQHLGERAIGVDDRRVVEAHERHSRRRRVERLLETAPRLLEGAPPPLPFSDVEETDDRPVGRPTRLVVGRLDDGGCSVGARQPQRHTVDTRPPARLGEPGVEVRPIPDLDELAQWSSGERRRRTTGQLGGRAVRTPHPAGGIDRDDGLGKVVEEDAQLRLGVDQALDRVMEVARDPPRLEPRDDDGTQGQPGGDPDHDDGRA